MAIRLRQIWLGLTLVAAFAPGASWAGTASRWNIEDPKADLMVEQCSGEINTYINNRDDWGPNPQSWTTSSRNNTISINLKFYSKLPPEEYHKNYAQVSKQTEYYRNLNQNDPMYGNIVALCFLDVLMNSSGWAGKHAASPEVSPTPKPQATNAAPQAPPSAPRPAPKAPAAPPDPKMVAGLAALDEVLGSPGGVLVKNTKRFDEDVGEIALHCLKIFNSGVLTRNLQLGNFCPYEVEATWCVMGVDCKPTFSNMHTLAPVGNPGSGHDIESTAGKGRGRTVQYAGCKGRNTVDIYREDPFTFTCRPVAQ